jgi:hypothetical protein
MRTYVDINNRRKSRKSQRFRSFGRRCWTFSEGVGKWGLVPAEGLLGAARLAARFARAAVATRRRSTWPDGQVVEPVFFYVGGSIDGHIGGQLLPIIFL